MYNVGFTGTRKGMTLVQKAKLQERLLKIKEDRGEVMFHYGQAIGADEEAAIMAFHLGYRIRAYPSDRPDQTSKRVDIIHESADPKPPLERNRDIVAASDELFATPETPHEQIRSGTWMTIREARWKMVPYEKLDP